MCDVYHWTESKDPVGSGLSFEYDKQLARRFFVRSLDPNS